ncbi:MAG: SPFH domain-containing protein [Halobacteriovoraceae bacterium]|nr:SPFH domain-containing protein [Halobacteriovoraceae bacterium]
MYFEGYFINFTLVILVPLFLIAFLCLVDGWFIVSHKNAKIIERLGKFHRIAQPGFNLKIPIVDKICVNRDLRINQLDVEVETKTKDNVFVRTHVSVQFYVMPDKIYESFYKLESPERQITSYVYDVVRAEIPKMALDSVFENKDSVATAIKDSLQESMDDFGYAISTALVTDIDPDERVKDSMNKINAAERDKLAAEYEAEAQKIRTVKHAEAESESKRLTGAGYANLRKEISKGIKESMDTLRNSGLDPMSATSMILTTQYLETLEKMASTGKMSTILLPSGPDGASSIQQQIISAIEASKINSDILNHK